VARLAPEKPRAASAQADYWNRAGARRWIDNQDILDQLLRPVSARLMAAARAEAGERVIDVGCGCGATTIDFGTRVAPGGEVLGLDISVPMLERARERMPAGLSLRFALGDAATHKLTPRWADLVVSRFGVMFFADPGRAFANLRQGLRPGGRLAFACWHAAKLNPWMTVPLREAKKHAPPLPEVGPEDPGPFSFADEKRVRRVLREAGYDDIALKPHEFDLDIALGRGLDTAVVIALASGLTSRILDGQSEAVRAAAAADIRAALAPHARGASVPLGAAIWIVTAANPDVPDTLLRCAWAGRSRQTKEPGCTARTGSALRKKALRAVRL
jgi:SAM-dependent methyltransferase